MMMSGFTAVSLSHLTAPVEVRESLSVKPHEAGRIHSLLRRDTGLTEAVVLSTCSRFEVYADAREDGLQALLGWLESRAGRELGPLVRVYRGREAVRHLFEVSGGLASWIMGESEIIGQVRNAYKDAVLEGAAGRTSHIAFQRALYVGKRVRSETPIVGGIASIGGAAAVLARHIFEDLSRKRILVFGAGQMAESVVRHLSAKGAGSLWVSNRSLERAQVLASRLRGRALSLPEGKKQLAHADIAVFSTGSADYLLDGAETRALAGRRKGRPLFIVDIAVPRNVDPAAARVEGVYLYDIDDLRRVVGKSLSKRKDGLKRAEEIVALESADTWGRIHAPGRPAAGAPRRSRESGRSLPPPEAAVRRSPSSPRAAAAR